MEEKLFSASKMTLLNILQNFTICLLKYFVSHIMTLSRNDKLLGNAFLTPEQIKQ